MKSYEYKGYRIYNNGYGFDIYKNGIMSSNKIASDFVSSDECEDYIDALESDIGTKSDVYLVVMLDGDKSGHIKKILHYRNNHLQWFSASDARTTAKKTMLQFFDFNQCKNFVNKRYDSSLAVQYGILKAKLIENDVSFKGEQLVYVQKISMKGD